MDRILSLDILLQRCIISYLGSLQKCAILAVSHVAASKAGGACRIQCVIVIVIVSHVVAPLYCITHQTTPKPE